MNLTVHRASKDKDHPYTVISNAAIRDTNLSLKTRGLLVFLLSLPPNWDFNVSGLVTVVGNDGRDAIRAALQELEANGYIVTIQGRTARGLILPARYELHETPPEPSKSPRTGFPATVKPATDDPATANPPQLNTDLMKYSGNEVIELETEVLGPRASPSSVSSKTSRGKEPANTHASDDAGFVAGRPLEEFQAAVDAAMARNVAMIRKRYWRRLDELVRGHASFDDTFGPQPCIAWSREEIGYLKEIAGFAVQHWPDRDPVVCTATLIRAAFRHGKKAFQVLKYWVQHGGKRLGLRPYLVLAGGQKDPAKRQDFLREIVATMDTPETRGAGEVADPGACAP